MEAALQKTPAQPIRKILPPHREIMRRLCLGARQREIARDMGINEGRLSIIINSPLFQLELKRMQRQRDSQVFEFQNRVYEGALRGAEFHNQVISGFVRETMVEDGKAVEVLVPVPVQVRQASASAMVGTLARIIKPVAKNEESGEGYESQLRRVRMTEEIITKGGTPASGAIQSGSTKDPLSNDDADIEEPQVEMLGIVEEPEDGDDDGQLRGLSVEGEPLATEGPETIIVEEESDEDS